MEREGGRRRERDRKREWDYRVGRRACAQSKKFEFGFMFRADGDAGASSLSTSSFLTELDAVLHDE